MLNTLSLSSPQTSIFWAKKNHRLLHQILVVIIGSLFITLCSHLQLPLRPIPVTLQDCAVISIGLAYGWRLASLTLCVYLLQGALGLPVFANGMGPLEFISPTAGYLIAFLPAAMTAGWLAERGWGRHVMTAGLAALVGQIIIFASGLIVLSAYVGPSHSLELGLYPFITIEIAKLAAMALLTPLFWRQQG